MSLGALGLLMYLRIKSDLGVFSDAWIISFTVAVFLSVNAGSFILCFRAKKYVCLFVLGELASIVLFSIQFYLLIDTGAEQKQSSETTRETVTY